MTALRAHGVGNGAGNRLLLVGRRQGGYSQGRNNQYDMLHKLLQGRLLAEMTLRVDTGPVRMYRLGRKKPAKTGDCDHFCDFDSQESDYESASQASMRPCNQQRPTASARRADR